MEPAVETPHGQLNGVDEHMGPGGGEGQHGDKEHCEPTAEQEGPAAWPEGTGRAKQFKGRKSKGKI